MSLGPTQILILPPLLCLGRIHRILRIYFVSKHGLLHRHHCRAAPAQNDPSDLCAKRCVAGAAALLRLHLCISASAAQVADGAASPGLHIGKCSLGELLIGSDASSVSPSSPASSNPAGAGSGAERRGTHGAHTWSAEEEEMRAEKRRKREGCLACLRPSPLTHQRAPDQPPQSAIQAEQTSFPINAPFSHPLWPGFSRERWLIVHLLRWLVLLSCY